MRSPRLSRRANYALACVVGAVGAALLVVGVSTANSLSGVLGALMLIAGFVLVPRARGRARR